MNQKKGLSGVVSAMIMIVIVMGLTLIVWLVITPFFNQEDLSNTKSCFDISISEQIGLNADPTCYDIIKDELKLGVEIGNVDVDEVIIIITTPSGSKSYILGSEPNPDSTLLSFSREPGVIIPNKNAGKTLIVTGFDKDDRPTTIEIAPRINDKTCEVTDKISRILTC